MPVQAELSSLGEPVHDHSRRVKGELLLMLLSKYANAFTASVDGTGDAIISGSTGHSSAVAHGRDDPVLAGGARVSYVFNEVFASAVQVSGFVLFVCGGYGHQRVHCRVHAGFGPV